jgi:hypothetical protein
MCSKRPGFDPVTDRDWTSTLGRGKALVEKLYAGGEGVIEIA